MAGFRLTEKIQAFLSGDGSNSLVVIKGRNGPQIKLRDGFLQKLLNKQWRTFQTAPVRVQGMRCSKNQADFIATFQT